MQGDGSYPVTGAQHTTPNMHSDTQPSRFALPICKASRPLPFGNSAFGTPYRTTLRHTTQHHTTPYHTVPHHTTPHHTNFGDFHLGRLGWMGFNCIDFMG